MGDTTRYLVVTLDKSNESAGGLICIRSGGEMLK
jgi:hypothetical protein